MTKVYHQLLASMPHLIHFDRLKALPISRQRFEARLDLLDRDDRTAIAWLRAKLWPEREPFRLSAPPMPDPPVFVRTIADRAKRIHATFAQRRDEEDVAALERQRLGALWDSADRLTRPYGFGLEAVARAVIRWDVATAWLAGDETRSGERIETLALGLVKPWRQCD